MTEQEEKVYFTYDEQDLASARIDSEIGSDIVEETSKSKKISREKIINILIFSAVGLVILTMLAFMVVKAADKRDKIKSISLVKENFYVSFYTYDGYGEGLAMLNEEVFLEMAEMTFSDRDSAREDAEELLNSIYVGMDEPYNLSNGDMVTVRVSVDDEILERLGVQIENREFTFEVTGLKPVTEFDPFMYMSVYLVEYGDRENYVIDYPEETMYILNRNDFEVTSSYKDGETFVHVNVKDDALERLTAQGVEFDNIGRTFNANEVDNKVISDYDDISERLEETFNEDATLEITELFNSYDGEIVLNNISYYGGWITTYENMNQLNDVIRVYVIEFAHVQNLFEPLKLYVKYEFSDAIVGLEGGSFLISKEGYGYNPTNVLGAGSIKYEVKGFTSINELLMRETLSSVAGYKTFDPNGNIQSFFTDEVIYK